MSPSNLIDGERASRGEFSAVVEASGATLTQGANASYRGRGWQGYRVVKPTTGTGRAAYGAKDVDVLAGPGEFFTMRCKVRVNSYTIDPSKGYVTALLMPYDVADAIIYGILIWRGDTDQVVFRSYTDAGTGHNTDGFTPALGRWYDLEVEAWRASTAVASDGKWALRVDGVQGAWVTGMDNYDRWAGGIDTLYVGSAAENSTKGVVDYDIDNVEVALGSLNRGKLSTPGVGCVSGHMERAGFGRAGVVARSVSS